MCFLHNYFKSVRRTGRHCKSLLLFWPRSVTITDLRSLSGFQRMSSFGISLGRRFGCPVPTSAINYTSALPRDSRICTWHGPKLVSHKFFLLLGNCLAFIESPRQCGTRSPVGCTTAVIGQDTLVAARISSNIPE